MILFMFFTAGFLLLRRHSCLSLRRAILAALVVVLVVPLDLFQLPLEVVGEQVLVHVRVVGLSRTCSAGSSGVTARPPCRRPREPSGRGSARPTSSVHGVLGLAGAAALLRACPTAGGTPRGRGGLGGSRLALVLGQAEAAALLPARPSAGGTRRGREGALTSRSPGGSIRTSAPANPDALF